MCVRKIVVNILNMSVSKWTHSVRLSCLVVPKSEDFQKSCFGHLICSSFYSIMFVRPKLDTYRTNLLTCTETHVMWSKRSGCHGGRCSNQGLLLGLTPCSDVRSDILEKLCFNKFSRTVFYTYDWEISFNCVNSAFTRAYSVTLRM